MFSEYVHHLANLVVQDWQARRRHRSISAWLIPAAIAAAAALITVALVVDLVTAIAHGIAHLAAGGGTWLHDWAFVRLVLDPVRSYLTAHAAGLPVPAATLWWTWAGAGIALFLLAWIFTAIGARIGWTAYGAATTAMVFTATAPPAQWTAAGVTALWWALLSLLALRRPTWLTR
jgi:hypothetical protein